MFLRKMRQGSKEGDVKWCCFGFKAGYENAGRRGSAMLVGRNHFGDPAITLQVRTVALGQEEYVRSECLASIVTDVVITFCPWCGVDAVKWYGNYVDKLFREGLKIPL